MVGVAGCVDDVIDAEGTVMAQSGVTALDFAPPVDAVAVDAVVLDQRTGRVGSHVSRHRHPTSSERPEPADTRAVVPR